MLTQTRIDEVILRAANFEDVVAEAREKALRDGLLAYGVANAMLFSEDGDLLQQKVVANLITQVGQNMYGWGGSAATGQTVPGVPTGMRLGSGTTAPALTGAGAAIVTYNSAATGSRPLDSKVASSNGTQARITYQATWSAGQGGTTINEAVITNESGPTDVAGTAANTIARVNGLAVSKAAGDTLIISWTHDIGT